MSKETVYFVHFSDTHLGPAAGYSRHGHVALPCAQRMVDIINNMPELPDFVVHTGDVVTDPTPEAYQIAAETFAGLRVPIYYVNGNHDRVKDIKNYLPMGPQEDLTDNPDLLSYAFERKGYRFVVLDARGPAEIDPQGRFPAEQLQVVAREAQSDGPPLLIFLHYPTLPLDAPWMDRNMLIQNGEEFHQALLPARDRLRGVFYGHVHRSMQTLRDGILYVAVGSTFAQFNSWPFEELVTYDFDAPPAYNFVQMMPEQTIVQQRTYRRSS